MLPAGKESCRVTQRVHAEPHQPSQAGSPLLPQSSSSEKSDPGKLANVKTGTGYSKKKRKKEVGRKVCEHCGWECSILQYNMHLSTHKPWLKCTQCKFTTKDMVKFRSHEELHRKGILTVKCDVCQGQYMTEGTLKGHMRRSHGIILCKDCSATFTTDEDYASHRDKVHNDPVMKIKSPISSIAQSVVSAERSRSSEFVCKLCNKECRNKFQLKIHIAQHLGVNSSDISDAFLAAQSVEEFENEKLLDSLKRSRQRKILLTPLVEGISAKQTSLEEGSVLNPPTEMPNDEFSFLPVIKEEPIDPAPSSDQNFVHTPQMFNDTCSGMPEEQGNIHSELKNRDREHCDRELPHVKCHECEDTYTDMDKLVNHCKQAHKGKLMSEILNHVQNLSTSVNTLSSRAREIKEEPIEFTLQSQKYDDDVSNQSLHSDTDTSVGSSVMEMTQSTSRSGSFLYAQDATADSSTRKAYQKQKITRKKFKAEIYCNECPEVFSTQHALMRHLEKHKKEDLRKIYTCPECEANFLTAPRIMRHFKVHHKNKFRCRYRCALLFNSKEEVFNHYKEFHNVQTTVFPCPYCGFEYQMYGFLLNHLERCTKCPPDKRPTHVCGNCEAVLENRREYNLHITKCKSLKNSSDIGKTSKKSNSSPEGQPSEVSLMDPLSTSHFLTSPPHHYLCKFCNMEFEELEGATEHCFLSHLDLLKKMVASRQTCKVCSHEFSSKIDLCEHLIRHYLNFKRWDDLLPRNLMELVCAKNYCWICQTNVYEDVPQHLQLRNQTISLCLFHCKETDTLQFRCTLCYKQFQWRGEYWKHVQGHLDELPVDSSGSDLGGSQYKECSICLLMFMNMEEFHRHLATHAVVFCLDKKEGDSKGNEIVTDRERRLGNSEREDDEVVYIN